MFAYWQGSPLQTDGVKFGWIDNNALVDKSEIYLANNKGIKNKNIDI